MQKIYRNNNDFAYSKIKLREVALGAINISILNKQSFENDVLASKTLARHIEVRLIFSYTVGIDILNTGGGK